MIPLISAPWNDVEGLFTPGRDYLVARDSHEMQKHLQAISATRRWRANSPTTVARRSSRGTPARTRVDELLGIYGELTAT